MKEKKGQDYPTIRSFSQVSPERVGEGWAAGARRKLLDHHLAGTLWQEESFQIPSICSGPDLVRLSQVSPEGHIRNLYHLHAQILLQEGSQPSLKACVYLHM